LNYPADELGDTIVLVEAYGSLSAARMQRLIDWVGQGGHLIATASNRSLDKIANVTDPLFDYFGVVIDRQNGEGMEEQVWELINRYGYLAGVAGDQLCPLLTAQTRFNFSGDDAELDVHFLSTDLLRAEGQVPDGWVGEKSYAYLLQFDVGEGMVTLVSSLDLWKNSAIGCLDHSYLLWQLAPEAGVMTMFSNTEFPGVMEVLWRYFDSAMVTATLLLSFWLWNRGVRFGPVRENQDAERRQLLEHIDASANFLWRSGKTEALVNDIRVQILQQIRKQHPQLRRNTTLTGKQWVEAADGQVGMAMDQHSEAAVESAATTLAAPLGLSADEINFALWQPIDNDPQRITQLLVLLQKIKEKT
jgi:hypothetical protein